MSESLKGRLLTMPPSPPPPLEELVVVLVSAVLAGSALGGVVCAELVLPLSSEEEPAALLPLLVSSSSSPAPALSSSSADSAESGLIGSEGGSAHARRDHRGARRRRGGGRSSPAWRSTVRARPGSRRSRHFSAFARGPSSIRLAVTSDLRIRSNPAGSNLASEADVVELGLERVQPWSTSTSPHWPPVGTVQTMNCVPTQHSTSLRAAALIGGGGSAAGAVGDRGQGRRRWRRVDRRRRRRRRLRRGSARRRRRAGFGAGFACGVVFPAPCPCSCPCPRRRCGRAATPPDRPDGSIVRRWRLACERAGQGGEARKEATDETPSSRGRTCRPWQQPCAAGGTMTMVARRLGSP